MAATIVAVRTPDRVRSPRPRRPRARPRSRPSRRGPASPSSTWPAEPAVEREHRADRHDRAQAVGRLERGDAHPVVAVAHVELRALAGSSRSALAGPARPLRSGLVPPRRLGRAPTRRHPRANRPSPSRRTRPCASSATASRWAVGPRQARGRRPARPASRAPVLHGLEHEHRLVEHADTAYRVFHKTRLRLIY